MPLELTDQQKLQILRALKTLPDLATIKQVSDAVGFEVTLPGMKPLLRAGLVALTEVSGPPVNRLSLTAAGGRWLDTQAEGAAVPVPTAKRAADGPMSKATPEQIQELQRRFDAGEGVDAEGLTAIATAMGISVSIVNGYRGVWTKRHKTPPAATATPAPSAGATTQAGGDPAPGGDKKELRPHADVEALYARFAAGEGTTSESKNKLAQDFGLSPLTIADHLTTWRKLQNPEAQAELQKGKRTANADIAGLHARFAAGEGKTAASKAQLAKDFDLSVSTVSTYRSDWNKAQKAAQAATAGAAAGPSVPPVSGKPLLPEDLERLEARFAAGDGETDESRAALADEFGIKATTVIYFHAAWRKNKPAGPCEPAALVAATAVSATASIKLAVGDEDHMVFSDDENAAQTEHQAEPAPQTTQDAAFDCPAPAAQIEQQSSTPTPESSTSSTPARETPPAPSAPATTPPPSPKPQAQPTSLALAMMQAGLVKPEQVAAIHPASARKRLCQVCGKPVDNIFWHEDTEHDLRGHKECVAAAVASRAEQEDDPGLPEPGEICEGAVFVVDAGGMYALVDLLKYCRPERKLWLRGKVTRAQILRQGWCQDVRDWLQDGDLVNVKVLDVTPGRGKERTRLNLSIKQAPKHPHERVPLELIEGAPAGTVAPIVATGAQVTAQLIATGDRQAAEEQAMAVILTHHLDPVHVSGLADRILAVGFDKATCELESDLKTMAKLKADAAVRPNETAQQTPRSLPLSDVVAAQFIDQVERGLAIQFRGETNRQVKEVEAALAELPLARERIRQLEEQLATARQTQEATAGANRLLEKELSSATAEREMATALARAANDEAARIAVGICAGCVHHMDRMCPYVEMYAPTFEVPDDDLAEQHKGRRIVFGRRHVVECDMHRPEPQLETAAD